MAHRRGERYGFKQYIIAHPHLAAGREWALGAGIKAEPGFFSDTQLGMWLARLRERINYGYFQPRNKEKVLFTTIYAKTRIFNH